MLTEALSDMVFVPPPQELSGTVPNTKLYPKIPKISPGAYIFQRPFLRGLFLEGLMYGGKFAFQNGLG